MMKGKPTKVIFRRYRTGQKEVFAIFPESYEGRYMVSMYQHVGQHGQGAYSDLISISVPAKMQELDTQHLLCELQDIGYTHLAIRKRFIWRVQA
jgi:hypothetical protein